MRCCVVMAVDIGPLGEGGVSPPEPVRDDPVRDDLGVEQGRSTRLTRVGKEDADPSDALAKTWKVMVGVGRAATAIVAFLASLARVNFSGATHEVHLRLWVVIAFVVALVGVAAFGVIYMYLNTKQVRDKISYWRSEAGPLAEGLRRLIAKSVSTTSGSRPIQSSTPFLAHDFRVSCDSYQAAILLPGADSPTRWR